MTVTFEWFAAGDPLDDEVVQQDPEAFDVNTTGRRYARFYQAMRGAMRANHAEVALHEPPVLPEEARSSSVSTHSETWNAWLHAAWKIVA